ncbi:hypothetical protein KMI_11g17290 [Encephalitozoon hellem]|uniref:Mechanosensitive ion channel MscS domain-containing protein n=1 Tax=Encephalitozoon hellem TaxID=27973 RepID=A0A9Q9FA42_ENCHE|nr:uncharacterized protein EHEL_090470 [Encephalitozoon hellem ATCC 50504]AFM98942.1 hypothetical protein EHEL_090470 [Encephalitozoon hellem ATCC 50504]KAG5858773.1 hypothetical protein KMI_11g17290 [Encephalitozoon hellem]UTX43956.1 hypothetical protein GPU96_09g17360 [Encephalitozoon hellem]WEL39441.1 hypothetical protein PFJ87_09g00690 [Encephalitozoon hellem]|eukprot:XP_003887923.1 hypothetical protein EHEL_090470 [Encephalitozoon hellem ATCC 50504]
MLSGRSVLKFPFLSLRKSASESIVPRVALSMAMLKPISVIMPKVLSDNLYKGAMALATCPFGVGDKIKIDKYDGVVKNISFWYVMLERGKGYVFIPTSHMYNTVVELLK